MPPKKDELVRAVVLCDSYKSRFSPLNRTIPRCLLPLANRPLIDYTLEFLQSARVSHVSLLCCAHADQVEKYIAESRWANAPFKLECISLPNSHSVGDALRDIDARGIITGDFMLISGDVVSNVDAGLLWARHQENKRKDKDCIMTITLRAATATQRTRSTKPGIYALQSDTLKVLSYKPFTDSKSISIDASQILDHPSCIVRNDLIDCHIDICTPDVPALFTENFDYENLRRDFVTGILQSELLGKNIYGNVLTSDYAARVEDFSTYDAISCELISRYAYPLTVDNSHAYIKGNIYKGKGVQLSQSCFIGHGTIIGQDTIVAANSRISHSTLGRNCQIGENVEISGSYIWDNVKIADGARVHNSFIANGATVAPKAELNHTIVSFDQAVSGIVDRGIVAEELSEDENDDSDNEDEEAICLAEDIDYLHLSDDSISSVSNKLSVPTSQRKHRKSRTLSTSSVLTADDDEEDFFKEAVASINRSIVDNHGQDVAILELNTLRMTMNASHDKVREAAVYALLSHIAHLITQGDVKTVATTVFETWSPLLSRITFDEESEIQLAGYIEAECSRRTHGDKLLFYAVSTLYDTDVLKEESILKWWTLPAVSTKAREITDKWIEWLRDADEESE